MRVMVTCPSGMLGQDVVGVLTGRGHEVVPLSHAALDITNLNKVRDTVAGHEPEVVINCAAYTAVDAAESDWKRALAVNGLGPRNLARACRENGADLLQVSTDYVFSGEKDSPYGVFDPPGPVNAYGRSKLWGELAVEKVLRRAYIVRTSWLFGSGPNFVHTMLKLGREKECLKVLDDQKGAPTYTVDLAGALADLVESRDYGVYHLTNGGATTWCGLAREIFRQQGLPVEVNPCTSADFPRPARRPANSLLDPFPLREIIGYLLPSWEDALGRYLSAEGIQ
ncbi:MAG TPA: dTDP-4-dehydrorhamnose reductase [Spirochaetia bacterium]|nr:dTDP-4-dehydrorhamnose reductase [Spirochaetia bacterium]